MTEKRQSVEQIKRKLDKANSRYVEIGSLIEKHEANINDLRKEQRSLRGWGSGEIQSLERDLRIAEQFESDDKMLKVVWSRGCYGQFVVEKVTAKQIVTRKAGAVSEGDFTRRHRFHLDGSPFKEWDTAHIDIKATFGIDSDEVPPNWKPSENKKAGE